MRGRLAVLSLLAGAVAFGYPNPAGSCELTDTAVLTPMTVGVPSSFTFATNGCGTPFYFQEIATGSLPPGITLEPGTLKISGTPTAVGTYAFALRLMDDSYQAPSKTFLLRVVPKLRIETPALASVGTGTAYSDQMRFSGGVGQVTWTIVGGALPTGLTMNISGTVSGTPAGPGTSTVRIRATDSAGNIAEKPYTIPVQATRITTTTTAPVGSVGTAYSFDIDADLSLTGFSVVLGTLPPGLTINGAGLISGTPTTAGAYHITVRCTLGNTSVWRSYYIPVNAAGSVSGTPRGAEQTFAYDHVFAVSGGVAPYSFSVTAGSLPGGIILDGASGALHGETGASASGTSFTITALDSTGRSYTGTFSIGVVSAILPSSSSAPDGAAGVLYSTNVLGLTGGTNDAKTFRQLDGALPPGVTLNASTGAFSGTPLFGGYFGGNFIATDTRGGLAFFDGASVYIYDTLTITKKSLPNAVQGNSAYSQFINTNGGAPTTSFAVTSGTIPAGMTFNTTTGQLTGPASTTGLSSFTITATDGFGRTASQAYVMRVSAGIAIDQTILPAADLNVGYSTAFSVNGGTTTGTWTVTSGSLPPGLTLSLNQLGGTPNTSGTFTFNIGYLSAASGFTDDRQFTINVSTSITIPTASPLPAATIGAAYAQSITASGGRAPYSFTNANEGFPFWLALNPATGLLSGTPAFESPESLNLRVTDADGRTTTKSFILDVRAPVRLNPATLPNGTRTVAYSQVLTATGGTNQYVFSSSGTLPPGLALTSGTIAGTPNTNGTYVFNVTATDTGGRTATRGYTVTIVDQLLITRATVLNNGALLTSYADTITTSGGAAQKEFTITAGNVPPLLSLNEATGAINNLPLLTGAYNFTIGVKDADGRSTTNPHQITVNSVFTITPPTLPNGTVGTAYSQALGTVGATPPVAFGVSSGALPGGLTLSAAGLLSGTPTTAGTFNFTVAATDAQFGQGSQAYTVIISSPLVISTVTLPNGSQGVLYNQLVQTTGGRLPVNVTHVAGTLPIGIAVGVTAADPGMPGATNTPVAGTPSTPGVYNFTLGATDTDGRTTNRPYTVTIFSPMVNTSTLGEGTEGEVYSGTLSVSGGAGGVTWSIPVGSLPAGLLLSASTGAITGTPTASGQFNFTARATDALGVQANFAVGIFVHPRLLITSAFLHNAARTVLYGANLNAVGGKPPYAWSLVGTALPAGLSLNTATGTVSGTTNASEGAYPQMVRVTDSRGRTNDRQVPLQVDPAPIPQLSLSPASMPNGRVGVLYSAGVSASGGTPPYTFAAAQGGLPPGTAFSGSTLGGTPSQEGTYRFSINVTDSQGRVAGNSYTVVIEPALLPLTVTPDSISGAQVNQPYSASFGATGGRAPYAFAISGALPAGVGFNAAGLLSGTPTEGGNFAFSVTVTDALQNQASKGYTLNVTGNLIITTQAPLADGTVGTPYSVGFGASGGRPPYTWQVSGTTPPGLAFDGASGALSGTPTQGGTFGFTVQVSDTQRLTASRGFSITILDRLQITNSPSDVVQPANQPYSFAFATTGGKAPVTFALTSGNLPPGLSLSGSGAISGTPTQGGSFGFSVEATDALGNKATGGGTIRIGDPLIVTTTSLPNGSLGVAYSAGVAASGGVAPLGAWSISAGSLPAGLSLGAGGGITGTPSATGTSNFTVRITDSLGTAATRALSITVGLPPLPPLNITGAPATLPPGQQTNVGVQITQPFPAPITGRVILEFTPAAANNADDPAVQFSSGGRTVAFNIPAGQTGATFPVDPLRILTGTVAGTIRIRIETTPAGTFEERTITIARSVPVITAGSVQQATGTFTVQVDGFSNTRELSGATFRFNPVAGGSLQTTELTLNVGQIFTAWYQSTASQPFGGQFRLTVPFTVQGTLNDVDTIVVTLTNTVGASQPFTIRLR